MTWHSFASIEELPELGTGGEYTADGRSFAVFHYAPGQYAALAAMCTHDDVPLAEGEIIDGERVECWAHCATFHLKTGQQSLPATRPAEVYRIRIEGQQAEIEFSQEA